MSIKVDIKGQVLKATKVDVQKSSAVTYVYVDKSRHSFIVLCRKGLYIYIFSTGNKIKNLFSTKRVKLLTAGPVPITPAQHK